MLYFILEFVCWRFSRWGWKYTDISSVVIERWIYVQCLFFWLNIFFSVVNSFDFGERLTQIITVQRILPKEYIFVTERWHLLVKRGQLEEMAGSWCLPGFFSHNDMGMNTQLCHLKSKQTWTCRGQWVSSCWEGRHISEQITRPWGRRSKCAPAHFRDMSQRGREEEFWAWFQVCSLSGPWRRLTGSKLDSGRRRCGRKAE
jgi:hypothetical protein